MSILGKKNNNNRGMPDDLHRELEQAGLMQTFESLSSSEQKNHIKSVTQAKDENDRRQKLQRVISAVKRESEYDTNRVKGAYGQTRTTG